MASAFVLAIDQGTTSTRAVVYDAAGSCRGSAALELGQHYPRPGWVEHDPQEIWRAVAAVVPQALAAAQVAAEQLAAIGIANQRETVVLWDRADGRPVAPAIVWQDRRTTDFCRQLRHEEPWLFQRTGLVLDPYFSATKIRWLLDEHEGLRSRAEAGQLACGTIDSWLLWNLTGGRVHGTDVSNASRTLLLNLHRGCWDDELLRFFAIPAPLLPQVHPSAAEHGVTAELGFLPAGLPIGALAGDQQAALFGQGCWQPGDAKCTYGTGAFFLQHTGDRPILSQHRLLASLAASCHAQLQYVLEGSVFVAGAAVQWLRDGLKLFEAAPAVEPLAAAADPDQPILFVPSLVGLGAPHWVPEARGVLFGLTRSTSGTDLARAALEGVAYQIADLVEAAVLDTGQPLRALRVDGGMANNAWFLQAQANLLGLPLVQCSHREATALGVAFLAGLQAGLWTGLDAVGQLIQEGRRFQPALPEEVRRRRLARWHRAVQAVVGFYSGNA